jgi:hypothetical protein
MVLVVRMVRRNEWRGMWFVQCLLFEEGYGAAFGEGPTCVGLPTGTIARLDCLPVPLLIGCHRLQSTELRAVRICHSRGSPPMQQPV